MSVCMSVRVGYFSLSVQCVVFRFDIWISRRRPSTHLQHHWSQGIFVNHTLACWWDISLLYLLLICCCSFFCSQESHRQKFRGKKDITLTPPTWNWPTYFREDFFNKYLSGYKANTFCPFVKTHCHCVQCEWKTVVDEYVRARSCPAGGSHWMDCIVIVQNKLLWKNWQCINNYVVKWQRQTFDHKAFSIFT